MNHIHTSTRACAGVLGLTLGLLLAHAQLGGAAWADEKIFAPQYCTPSEPGEELPYNIDLRITEVRQIGSEGLQEYICPLVRDDIDGELDDVWVRVFNRRVEDGNAPACCVYSISLGASFQDYECEAAANVYGRASIHLTLDDFTEYEYGHYAVFCDLGLTDSIISIRTRESP